MYEKIKADNRRRIERYDPRVLDGKADFYPAYMQIEQTNRCNAQCIMCNHFYLGNRGCGDLSAEVLERIAPVLPYCQTVMLNGDGEPFLSATIESSLRCYHQYGVKIGTNTNLSYIPEAVWPYFASTFGFINISCDACTPERYEMIRPGLSFDRFQRNLERMKESAPGLKKNIDCVVMKQNITELPGIVRLAHAYGIAEVRFHRLGVNPIIGNDADRAEYYYDMLRDQLLLADEEGRKTGVRVVHPKYEAPEKQAGSLPTGEEMIEELRQRKKTSELKAGTMLLGDDYYSEIVTERDLVTGLWDAGKVCRWAIERCYVDIKGNVTTCCSNMKKHMGSLLHQTFEEIWNGDEYVALRRNMARHLLPGFCRQCNWIKEAKF